METFKELEAIENGSSDNTLVNFLEDNDLRVRFLGVQGLLNSDPERGGGRISTDPALASKVLDAADKGLNDRLDICEVAAHIDLKASGSGERVMKMLEETKDESCRGQPGITRTLVG